MQTKIIKIENNRIAEDVLQEAGQIIKEGGLVAFPTETVYGLGGDGLNPLSAKKIYEAKGRPSDNPLIIHLADISALEDIVLEVPETARKLAEAFWPGPLTMVLPKSSIVPMETTGGLQTVAVRMPDHEAARMFIRAAGGYVAAPSANRSGRPSPTLARYVEEDMNGRIEMILDGGRVGIGLESTIIDLTEEKPVLLRPGYITVEMLSEVVGEIALDTTMMRGDSPEAPKAPGMKYKHYAPRGEMTIVSGDCGMVVAEINRLAGECQASGAKTGVIATDETMGSYCADSIKSLGRRTDEDTIAVRLYQVLREFDEENVDYIYSEAFSQTGRGQAIMNRLLKAAGYQIITVINNEREQENNDDSIRM